MRWARRAGIALGVTALAAALGAQVTLDHSTPGSFVRSLPLTIGLLLVPAVILGRIRLPVTFWLATAAISVLSFRCAQLAVEDSQSLHPASSLALLFPALRLLLIPYYGVAIAGAFLLLDAVLRAGESARAAEPVGGEPVHRTVLLRGALRIPARTRRSD